MASKNIKLKIPAIGQFQEPEDNGNNTVDQLLKSVLNIDINDQNMPQPGYGNNKNSKLDNKQTSKNTSEGNQNTNQPYFNRIQIREDQRFKNAKQQKQQQNVDDFNQSKFIESQIEVNNNLQPKIQNNLFEISCASLIKKPIKQQYIIKITGYKNYAMCKKQDMKFTFQSKFCGYKSLYMTLNGERYQVVQQEKDKNVIAEFIHMYSQVQSHLGFKPIGSIFKQNKQRKMKSHYIYDQKLRSVIIPNKSFKQLNNAQLSIVNTILVSQSIQKKELCAIFQQNDKIFLLKNQKNEIEISLLILFAISRIDYLKRSFS